MHSEPVEAAINHDSLFMKKYLLVFDVPFRHKDGCNGARRRVVECYVHGRL